MALDTGHDMRQDATHTWSLSSLNRGIFFFCKIYCIFFYYYFKGSYCYLPESVSKTQLPLVTDVKSVQTVYVNYFFLSVYEYCISENRLMLLV